MADILNWGILVWTIRVALTILVAGLTWIAVLYFFRFVRPTHIGRIACAPIPDLDEWHGEGEAFGFKAKVGAKFAKGVLHEVTSNSALDKERDARLMVLEERLRELEGKHSKLTEVSRAILVQLQALHRIAVKPGKEGDDA